MKGISKQIKRIVKELKKREREQDEILSSTREIIRHCANGIKLIHSGEVEKAKNEIFQAEKKIAKFSKTKQFAYLLEQPYQEIAEARLLLCAVERLPFPTYHKLGMPFEPYILGMCDLVGELRRQMLEMLKKGKIEEAEYYFEIMSKISDELAALRFSNSLLPNFKKKQDMVRLQVEQARSELVRAKIK
ncbi:MAG: hypothetical protein QW275_02695 [Candidatus Anstonellaceae archaeon]